MVSKAPKGGDGVVRAEWSPPWWRALGNPSGRKFPADGAGGAGFQGQVLQRRVPELVCCSPAMAEAVQRAIRETICTWSGGMACPHCRGEAGIVDPTDPGALAA